MFSEYFFKSKSLFYSLLVTLPLFIIYEVGIFFLLETALGPLWVWFFISEVPTEKTLIGGIFIIIIIFIHSYYMIRKERSKRIC